MSKENLVSIQIDGNDLGAMHQKVQELKALLKPHLVALQPKDRQKLPKMKDKSLPFVEKTAEYARSRPEFVPSFMQVDELEIDLKAVADLTQLYRELEQLCAGLNDTIMLSGSEAYRASLTYYNAVKQATKNNVPNAQSVYEDLSKRFER